MLDEKPGLAAGMMDGCERAIPAEIEFLQRHGIHRDVLDLCARRARLFDIAPLDVLLRHGVVREDAYYAAMAAELGLPFTLDTAPPGEPFFHFRDPADIARAAKGLEGSGEAAGGFTAHFAPDAEDFAMLRAFMRRAKSREIGRRFAITPRSVNRQALEDRCRDSLLKEAVSGLRERFPSLSASRRLSWQQVVALVLLFQTLLSLFLLQPGLLQTGLHLGANAFFLTCAALRVLAAASFDGSARTVPQNVPVERSQDHRLPVYSVLVPIYREANQVDALVANLMALDWPKERLDIRLLCEEDDTETLATVERALARLSDGAIRCLRIPVSEPRTKPKALAYALPHCTGDYVVIYDAEDRPHPLQLREAYARFSTAKDDLACLQAPLVIHNHREGILPTMFAVEYSTLFDGILPFLARAPKDARVALPLGGTSNHFRGLMYQTHQAFRVRLNERVKARPFGGIRLRPNGSLFRTP